MTDRPLLGIAFMLGFCVLAPLGDAIAKLLGATIPLGQLLLVRFAFQAITLLPAMVLSGGTFRVTRRIWALTVLRTVFHLIGIGMMYTSLRFLPLADALAIAFVMPFIMLLLGRFVLGEEVGRTRILACGVGFVGTMLVIQPSFAAVGAPALLPLGVAVTFALFMLTTRQIARDTDPVSLQAVSGVIATGILLAGYYFIPDVRFIALKLVMPDYTEGLLLLAIGVIGTVAHLLMTWSLRFAPSATVAPMQYLEIPVATVLGLLIFNQLPNGIAAIGIAITIASGLFVIWRERAIAEDLARAAIAD